MIGVLGMIPKGLVKGLKEMEIGGRVETIQTTALLGSARILRRFRETATQTPVKDHHLTLV